MVLEDAAFQRRGVFSGSNDIKESSIDLSMFISKEPKHRSGNSPPLTANLAANSNDAAGNTTHLKLLQMRICLYSDPVPTVTDELA